jgi:hypothetical protein
MIRSAACSMLAVVLALSGVACGKSTTSSTSTTTTVSPSTELFTGTLSPKGSTFYSFTVSSAGTAVAITLASTATSKIGPTAGARLRLGFGTPSGFGCAVTSSVDTAAGLSAQLSNPSTPADSTGSIYCVQVSDPGQLTADVLFVIRIVHT